MSQSPDHAARAEYIIAIRHGAASTGPEIVGRALTEAIERHWEQISFEAGDWIVEEFRRRAGPEDASTGSLAGPLVFGFRVELPVEVDRPALVFRDLCEVLGQDADVEHVLKFYDTTLEEQNLGLARELLGLEMRLRRALSLVYLHAYGGSYYDLLRNDNVGADGNLRKRMPKVEDLRAKAENQFFHLMFNHYGELNVLRSMRATEDLAKLVAGAADFAELQRQLQAPPVQDEDDREFLDRIKGDLKPVEDLRNCIMHNRTPTSGEIALYEHSRDVLNEAMEELFGRWRISFGGSGTSDWDAAARDAAVAALDNAEWDDEAKTISFNDPADERNSVIVSDRETLAVHLRELASDAFYGEVPRLENEYLEECDEYGIVDEVLADYEAQLDAVFGKDV